MNENNKSFMYGCVVGVLVGFLLCYTMQGGNTDKTISAIKEQQHGVNTEIRNATTNLRESQNAVQRASNTISNVQGRLESSQRVADNNAREIERISTLARECLDIAKENRAILNNVREADSNR